MKEASIPVTRKIYCPYPTCSALMSKNEVLEHSKSVLVGVETSGARKCIKCNRDFCINCKVPWHSNMTCFDYKTNNPYPQEDEAKLKNLAATNSWKECEKCKHWIELSTGCSLMTCRCGHEFCYACGAEWKNKKATCKCALENAGFIFEHEEEPDEDIFENEEEPYEDIEAWVSGFLHGRIWEDMEYSTDDSAYL